MSLWVHKYRPATLDGLDYHTSLTKQLRTLASEEDFPHLLVYGPPGAGKQTRVAAILHELYGPAALRIKIESRILEAGSRKIDFNIVSSVHHVEITPSEAGNQDRVVIQDLLKDIAQTQQVDTNSRRRFKVVVINEADSLSRDAQAALRRTMEIYSPNLRLIMIATSLSNIMAPIQSRTLLIRVAAPSRAEVEKILQDVAHQEHVKIEPGALSNIADLSNRNLRKALLMLEAMFAQNENITATTPVPVADWEQMVNGMADQIVKSRTVQQLAAIRAKNYELIAHCIPPQQILKSLLFAILDRVSAAASPAIIECGAKFDHRLRLGSKAIFHLEAFVANVMRILELQQMK